MRPVQWMSQLLKRHGLSKPDGRPLYQYRLTDTEFDDLENLLKCFNSVNWRLLMWDAAMVFYAAEWWRRYYSGEWGWKGIFDSVDIDINEVTTQVRNRLVEIGLQRWQRPVRILADRRRFLGTVATEGGLPLKQLAESGGWMRDLLDPVIKKHLQRGLAVDVLIDAYADNIPSSYDSTEIKQVLADMVKTMVDLRTTYELEHKSEPSVWLDEHITQWREQFPLPIEDDVGRSLLSELIGVASTVVAVKTTDVGTVFAVDRFIINVDFSPQLHARVDVPSHIYLDNLNGAIEGSLPGGRVDVEIFSDEGDVWPWCWAIRTMIDGQEALKLSGRSLELTGEDALKGLSVRLKSIEKVWAELPVLYADKMELDLPWLFKQSDTRLELHGSASQSVSDDRAVVYLPDGFRYEKVNEKTRFDKIQSFFEGALFRLEGTIACHLGHAKYVLKTAAEESVIQYELSGHKFSGAIKPSLVFIGAPDVFQRNVVTGNRKRLRLEKITARLVGSGEEWIPVEDIDAGYYELRVLDDNIIRWRKRVGILPASFNFNLMPDKKSALKGEIKLTACTDFNLSIKADDCKHYIILNDYQACIGLEAKDKVPGDICVSMLPPHTCRELVLKFPFPSSGAVLYSPEGENLNSRISLHLDNLYGYRLRIFNGSYQSKTAHLRFSLFDDKIEPSMLRDIFIEKKIRLVDQVTELALIDWVTTIRSVSGISIGMDARVKVSLIIAGIDILSVDFKRYEYDLREFRDKGEVSLDRNAIINSSIDSINGAVLKTLLLHQPEQKTKDLVPLQSQGVPSGIWDFAPEKREKGHWLIYPGRKSSIRFRPLFWKNSDEKDRAPVFADTLPKAMQIGDTDLREQAVKRVLCQMSRDLDHHGWDYLSHLIDKCGHLPLATFGIWRVSVTKPGFLAALFVKSGFENMIARLEGELPIIWELVRVSDWASVLKEYRNKLVASLSDENALGESDQEDINRMLGRKIDAIGALSVSMQCVAKILRTSIIGERDKEIELMKMPMNEIFKPQVRNEQQGLLRRQYSRNEWPQMLGQQIESLASELPDELQELIEVYNDFQRPVLLLPVILAWRVNTKANYGWSGSAVDIFKIEQLKNFDEDWFNAVFNFASGWISQHIAELEEEKSCV